MEANPALFLLKRQRAEREGAAGDYNDLHELDPAGPAWTNLSGDASRGAPPPPRDLMGFAADGGGGGGRLFVFGGWSVALNRACLPRRRETKWGREEEGC